MERMEIVSRLVASFMTEGGMLWHDAGSGQVIHRAFVVADQIIAYDREHPIKPKTQEAKLMALSIPCSSNCTPENLCPSCADKAFPKAS